MKRFTKLLSVLILVLVMCFAVSSLASAVDTIPQAESSTPVNGGLEAEILTEAEEDDVLPVTVKITNTNTYEVSDVSYKLTATENGRLFGSTSDSNLTIAGGDSITASMSLKAVPEGVTPQADNNIYYTLWVVLSALSIAIAAFISGKDPVRQSLAILLVIVELASIFAVGGAPASGTPEDPSENNISFIVNEDVVVGGETIGLSLEVTLKDSTEGDEHTVTFMDSDNKAIKSFVVADGESLDVSDIPIPTKTGKAFYGWFLDADMTEPFYSEDPVKNDLTVLPLYDDLNTSEYNSPVYNDAGFVPSDYSFTILSEREITTDNLAEFATLEKRFGEAPSITVRPLGNNKYELAGTYPGPGTFCWRLIDDSTFFDGLEPEVREHGFSIIGEETEEFQRATDLVDIDSSDVIELEATEDEYVSFLNVFGSSFAVDDKLGIKDENDVTTYYKVTEVIGNTVEPSSGKNNWRLRVTPCAIEEVYDEIDINQYNQEADEIIDLSNPEDIESYTKKIENSEEMRVYADYLASAINDSEEFQRVVEESYGTPAYIGYQSNTMRTARAGDSSLDNTGDAIDEALELVGGIEVNRPGVNVSISASPPKIKLNDFNSYWDERYAEVGEIDPETGEIVNVGKTDFFGNNFASIETEISVSFSLNGGTKNIAVTATLKMKQYVKICSATQVKLNKGWKIYSGSEIHAGATAYTETSVDYTVTLKTDNGGFDITEEIEDIVSAAKGEKYETDNRYIKRFRNLYDGSERDFVEVYRHSFCNFKFGVGPVEINIPVAFVVRFGLSAGVGIGYDYRTTYTVGVYKEKDSTTLTPYYSSGAPGWNFDFYVAGHAGVKLALNAKLGITISGCSKLFEIGLEAEFGLRADFYGYFLLSHEKEWSSYDTNVEVGGAYYFNTKVYFDLKLYAKAFVYENKWDLFSWEYTIFSSGNRYVLLDFERRHAEDVETIVIPITEESKMTTVVDCGTTYQTVAFSLDSYFDSLEPVFFDLQKSNEVFENETTKELINKYTTVTTGGGLTLPNGRSSVTGPTTVHLRPYALNRLLNNEIFVANAYITITYNGPVFTFGDDRPSVTYNVKLVSEKYVTGEKYDVNYWVDGKLYQTKEYTEGMSISSFDAYVDKEYIASRGLKSAKFSIPLDVVSGDMDLYAKVSYYPNNKVIFKSKVMTPNGIDYPNSFFSHTMCKNDNVSNIQHPSGNLQPYFIGWDLVGDNSDELNVPIPGQNTTYTYEAVYGEMPEYTVTVLDGTSGTVLSEENVALGDSITIDEAVPPDDGLAYVSDITRVRGTYASSSYTLEAGSVVYPLSDVTFVWNHQVKQYEVSVYSNVTKTVIDTQYVEHGKFITDPLGEDNWSELDYRTDNGSCYELIGWEVWNGTEFVDAMTYPITKHSYIYPVYRFIGIKHDITLLDEDEETVLFSGLIGDNRPLTDGYYVIPTPDKEYNYDISWKSAEDDSVVVYATKSGTYILEWVETAREYTISLDEESEALTPSGIDFEDGIPYGDLNTYIAETIGDFVPEKPETDYCTYTYDGFSIYCEANANGEYGICTVSFDFTAVPKKCAVTFDVTDSHDNTGALMHGQEELTLEGGVYELEFTLSEANSELLLVYEVTPNDCNYNFAGWSFNGSVYEAGDSVSLVGFDTAVFTAVYELKPYAVTFNADGGVFEGDATVYANDDEIISLPTPTKAPSAQYTYSFTSWANADNDSFSHTYQVSGNITLTAKYTSTLRSYNITFDANGGVFEGDKTELTTLTPYGSTPAPEIPTRASTVTTKYTFAAWSPELTEVTGTATYTATWTETNLYTLTFDAGNGSFAAGVTQKTYVIEDGESFSLSTVPVPYYNYSGEVKKFTGWTPNTGILTVTENASFTATWSEPVSAMGILITDGVNTEDIAANLAGASLVTGYSLEYIQAEEGFDPFFALSITADGLTLSGSGSVESTDLSDVNVTLKDLTMTGNIYAYGTTAITVDGTVTVSTDNNCAISLSSVLDAPEGTPKGTLSFIGADADAKLIINSTGGAAGISSYDGDISINGLNVEITASEILYEGDDDIHIPVALGALDTTYNVTVTNSSLLIHKGYFSGLITLTNSTVEFDDNEYNGLICYYYDYSETPVIPDHVMLLNNSVITFNKRAYIVISYSQINGESDVYYDISKQEAELDMYGNPVVGWFTTNLTLNEELNNPEDAWLVDMDEDSSIQIVE